MALRDIFQQLFPPSEAMSLSRGVMRIVWRVFQRFARRRPEVFVLVRSAALLTACLGHFGHPESRTA